VNGDGNSCNGFNARASFQLGDPHLRAMTRWKNGSKTRASGIIPDAPTDIVNASDGTEDES
jgi:hypothetical protein